MRTNVILDDMLMQEAMALSGLRTKKEIISMALQEFVQTRKRRNLLDLSGKIKFQDDYDYKACRQGR